MNYISENDLKYLKNKYHRDDGSFNPFSRFICNDSAFDMNTGLDSKQMEASLREYLATLTDTDHGVIKAKAFRFVLEHTPINVSANDYFVAIHSADRVISHVLCNKWNNEVFGSILPEVNKHLDPLRCDGALTTWPDYDHSVPNYDYILPLGFVGMLEKAREAEAHFIEKNGGIGESERAFYESIYIELEAILALLDRFTEFAEKNPSEKSDTVIAALTSLKNGAPKNTYEALLFIYIYFICSEHIEMLQVRSLSNLDRMLYQFYKNDLESKRFTENELRTFLAYFLYQFSAIGNYWNQPLYLGGTNPDGSSVINELSYVILDVYDKLGIFNPKLQIKYSTSTPKAFILKALDMIRHGHNSIVFVCDDTMTEALMKLGASEKEARLANVSGCYEYSPREEVGSLGAYVNLAKFIEYTLWNGFDPKTGLNLGISLGEAEKLESFEDFFKTFLGYLNYTIDECIPQVNSYEPYYGYVNPIPLFSAARVHSLEVAKDAYSLGAAGYQTIYEFGALATTVDSLTMIKKYVYDTGTITISELKAALKADFVGYEPLRARLKFDREKLGNNTGTPEALAKRLADILAKRINGTPDGRGGKNICGLHCARQYIDWKDRTASTPDGRVRGEELSKNATPTQGAAVKGPTSVILSILNIDATEQAGDCPIDLALHPSAFTGDSGLEAMYALLRVCNGKKAHAVQFNVIDVETLKKAQVNPDEYRDLQIRVCGWNAHFVTLGKAEQDAFISAAEGTQ